MRSLKRDPEDGRSLYISGVAGVYAKPSRTCVNATFFRLSYLRAVGSASRLRKDAARWDWVITPPAAQDSNQSSLPRPNKGGTWRLETRMSTSHA